MTHMMAHRRPIVRDIVAPGWQTQVARPLCHCQLGEGLLPTISSQIHDWSCEVSTPQGIIVSVVVKQVGPFVSQVSQVSQGLARAPSPSGFLFQAPDPKSRLLASLFQAFFH